jgi:excisionase family DNA binding protein
MSNLRARVPKPKTHGRGTRRSAPAELKTNGSSQLPQKWDGRAVFNVEELAEILRTNTWTIYEAIKRKEISVVRIGRVIRVARPVVEKMLAA